MGMAGDNRRDLTEIPNISSYLEAYCSLLADRMEHPSSYLKTKTK
jgi:hypothetical protein